MTDPVQELAYIRRVVYGYSPERGVGLSMDLQLLRGVVTLFIETSEVTKIITNQKILDVTMLTSRPCVVIVTDGAIGFSHLL